MELYTTKLNYKSFAKRCPNQVICRFVDQTLRSIQNLPVFRKQVLVQIDENCEIKMAYVKRRFFAFWKPRFPARVRISAQDKLVVDLYDDDIIVEKPKK